jgi:hypothetical protein
MGTRHPWQAENIEDVEGVGLESQQRIVAEDFVSHFLCHAHIHVKITGATTEAVTTYARCVGFPVGKVVLKNLVPPPGKFVPVLKASPEQSLPPPPK